MASPAQRLLDVDPILDKHHPHNITKSHGSIFSANASASASASASAHLSGTTAVEPTTISLDSEELPLVDLRFTTVAALLQYLDTIESTNTDSITVGGVTRSHFDDIDQTFRDSGRKRRLFFLAKHKLLIITIPTGPHEGQHLLLYERIRDQINIMGLVDSWTSTGATRFPGGPRRSASQGEGDSGGKPHPEREDKDDWPTIIVEAGYTQSLASLRTKMRFWFTRSNHEVKILLLVKAFPDDHSQKRILIEQWQERDSPLFRPGATMTRLSSALPTTTLQPVCIQTINIVWAIPDVDYENAARVLQTDLNSFNVVRGPLRLEFNRLFLRLPVYPGEHDIILLDSQLQWLATKVWRM